LCRFLMRLGRSLPEDTPGRYASAYSELTFAAWRSEGHEQDAVIGVSGAYLVSKKLFPSRARHVAARRRRRSRQKSRGKRPVSTRGADSSGPLRAVRTNPRERGERRAPGGRRVPLLTPW
jgi:hypothetical protein